MPPVHIIGAYDTSSVMSSENICRIFASPPRRTPGGQCRDSMRDPASSYVIRNSVRPARQELGPRAGPGVRNGIQYGINYSMPELHAGARGLARDRNFHAGFNAGPCFFARGQGFRADLAAGSGTPPGTRSPTRDPMRHHVSRSGFGGTCGILCRSSMSGPGASLRIETSMRDSM